MGKPNADDSVKSNGTLRERVNFQSRITIKVLLHNATHLLHFVKPHQSFDGETPAKKPVKQNNKNKLLKLQNTSIK
jgi:hypothetical protein